MSTESEPDQATVDRVETTLRDDITWAVAHGPGWNPMKTAQTLKGKFVVSACGVCAIGAHVLRAGLTPPHNGIAYNCNVDAAAKSLDLPRWWLNGVCLFVADDDHEGGDLADNYPKAWGLSRRLRAFAAYEVARVGKRRGGK